MQNYGICACNSKNLQIAKKLILADEVIAFPTETVYGLGGNAFSDLAVQKIFALKGRPADNPLIVHIHSAYDIFSLVERPLPYGEILLEKLTPGPITFVMRKKAAISQYVSANLDTIAIRIPQHAMAQAFLKTVNLPIAAPSANISTHTSPVIAEHVLQDFKDKVPLIFDGGRSVVGIESTVCDITGEIPVILREGVITQNVIAKLVGNCLKVEQLNAAEFYQKRSPGTRYRHYAPHCETKLFTVNAMQQLQDTLLQLEKTNNTFAILAEDKWMDKFKQYKRYNLGKTAEEMAQNLYMHLRTAELEVECLCVLLPEGEEELLKSIQNRLKKACHS